MRVGPIAVAAIIAWGLIAGAVHLADAWEPQPTDTSDRGACYRDIICSEETETRCAEISESSYWVGKGTKCNATYRVVKATRRIFNCWDRYKGNLQQAETDLVALCHRELSDETTDTCPRGDTFIEKSSRVYYGFSYDPDSNECKLACKVLGQCIPTGYWVMYTPTPLPQSV